MGAGSIIERDAGAIPRSEYSPPDDVAVPQRLAKAASELPAAYSVSILEGSGALFKIKDEWIDLEKRAEGAATIFQSFHWCEIAARDAEARGRRVIVIAVRNSGGDLVLVWPLAVQRKRGVHIGRWLGDPMTQYGDILIDAVSACSQLVAQAFAAIAHLNRLDVLLLRKVRGDAAIWDFLIARKAQVVGKAQAPIRNLDQTGESEGRSSPNKSKAIRERRRLRRRLGEFGAITFATHRSSCEAAAHVRTAVAFKEQWLAERSLMSSAVLEGQAFAVLEEMAKPEGEAPILVSRLAVGEATAAVEVGFTFKDNYYAFLGAFNPTFASAGPGTIQMEETIRWGARQGWRTYDLFAPADPYKLQWANSLIDVTDFALSLNWWGAAYIAIYVRRLRPVVRKTYDALPARGREWLARLLVKLLRSRGPLEGGGARPPSDPAIAKE